MNGYKTYTVAAVAVLWALYGWFSGYLDPTAAQQIIETALVGAGLRSAISRQ